MKKSNLFNHSAYLDLQSLGQNAYILAWGGFMLLGGKLSDTYGRKIILNLSLILFGLGSLFAGLATSAQMIICARFLQGVGSAILAPTSLALIIDYFDGAARIKVISWYSSISGLGLCFGLVFGGAITSFLSWRDGFLVNIPFVLFMLFISFKVLNKGKHQKEHFDVLGTVFSIIGVFSLVYTISGADNKLLWLAIAFIALTIFICIESKVNSPILPLALFKSATRSKAYIARALFVGAMMGFNFMTSIYLQKKFSLSPFATGIAFLPMTVSTFIAAIRVPHLIARKSNRKILCYGLICMGLGFALLSIINADSTYLLSFMFPLFIIGIGNGLTLSPLTNLGVEGVSHKNTGSASGLVNTSHQIGGAIGLAIMMTLSDKTQNLTESYQISMLCALFFIILAFIETFIIFPNK